MCTLLKEVNKFAT